MFWLEWLQARITDLNEQGIVPKLFIVGRKGVQALTTRMQQENRWNHVQFFPLSCHHPAINGGVQIVV